MSELHKHDEVYAKKDHTDANNELQVALHAQQLIEELCMLETVEEREKWLGRHFLELCLGLGASSYQEKIQLLNKLIDPFYGRATNVLQAEDPFEFIKKLSEK